MALFLSLTFGVASQNARFSNFRTFLHALFADVRNNLAWVMLRLLHTNTRLKFRLFVVIIIVDCICPKRLQKICSFICRLFLLLFFSPYNSILSFVQFANVVIIWWIDSIEVLLLDPSNKIFTAVNFVRNHCSEFSIECNNDTSGQRTEADIIEFSLSFECIFFPFLRWNCIKMNWRPLFI